MEVGKMWSAVIGNYLIWGRWVVCFLGGRVWRDVIIIMRSVHDWDRYGVEVGHYAKFKAFIKWII